jgi:hypothetical protein
LSQDVTDCPRCQRRTPAARGECIYCGEPLPFFTIQSAPPQRNIDSAENAFNTVLEPSLAPPNEGVAAALAAALQVELADAQSMIGAGKPVPLARSQTRPEAEMIVALVRTCGVRAVVIADEELGLQRELLRARRIAISDDEIRVRHSGGELVVKKAEIKLLVLGDLRNTRVDYSEGIGGIGARSGSVLDSSEYRSDESVLDVYAGRLDKSFRIRSDAFDYSGLVSPMSFRAHVNFQRAAATLNGALPSARLDEDFPRMRSLLDRAWPARTRNEARGIKRTGLAFRAVAQASVISDNRDQFDRYSRLMFRDAM